MLGGIAEQDNAGSGALEIQMCWMLPGEAHPAVDLDVLGRGVKIRFRAVRLGEMRRLEYILVAGDCEGRMISGGTGELGFHEHISAFVLDCLERADRTAELQPGLGVLGGHLKASLRSA